jgi:hypothetical protein
LAEKRSTFQSLRPSPALRQRLFSEQALEGEAAETLLGSQVAGAQRELPWRPVGWKSAVAELL